MALTLNQIRDLSLPPNSAQSRASALSILNADYRSLQDLDVFDLEKRVNDLSFRTQDLHAQFTSSESNKDAFIGEAFASAQTLVLKAQEASLSRHQLADELAQLLGELAPDPASSSTGRKEPFTRDLQYLHEKLQEFELSRNYVAVIQRALHLGEFAVSNFKPSREDHFRSYNDLVEFILSVRTACKTQPAERIGLTEYLVDVQRKTWREIKTKLSEDLLRACERLRWPMSADYLSLNPLERAEFETAFSNLLQLQQNGEKLHISCPEILENEGLYPLEAMVRPVAQRFKYHFEGKRQTNRLDKPEWYLTHIMNVVHEHRRFMEASVQPLLHRSSFSHVNAFHEFIRLLLPLLSRKIRQAIPILVLHPSIFAHTIYQTLLFDASIRDVGFALDTTASRSRESEWSGLTDVILGRSEWFNAWVREERKFADNQYMEVISSPGAWLLSAPEEEAGEQDTRSTNSARRVKAIFENITERYRPLPNYDQRFVFLTTIQLPIMRAYYDRITSSLDAYETLSSAFIRAVPGALAAQVGVGADVRRLTLGVDGISRLVKALLSATWLRDAMEHWGDDIFFLDLWTHIRKDSTLSSQMSCSPDQNTLFEDLAQTYSKLAARAEDMIFRQICAEVESALKDYLYNDRVNLGADISVPQSLVVPLSLLSSMLQFLSMSLPTTTLVTLYRRVANSISAHLVQKTLSRSSRLHFSPVAGRAFADECELWIEACRSALGGKIRMVEVPWSALADLATVVSVPADRLNAIAKIAFEGTPDEFIGVIRDLDIKILERHQLQDALRLRDDVAV